LGQVQLPNAPHSAPLLVFTLELKKNRMECPAFCAARMEAYQARHPSAREVRMSGRAFKRENSDAHQRAPSTQHAQDFDLPALFFLSGSAALSAAVP
jgi:hypothetical protein